MTIFRHLARRIHGPRCHLDADEKAWVERRMIWLKQQFGSEPIRRAPLGPASPLLPKKWDRTREAGAELFHLLCEFMRVERERVSLQFCSTLRRDSPSAGQTQSSGPLGLYCEAKDSQKRVIALDITGLGRPAALAATICHELAHVHLLGDQRISRDEADGEPLTDLLTVYFGAGILTANSAFDFRQWQEGSRGGWSVSRQGYLSEPLYGYALACFAWFRGDLGCEWKKYLRENVAYYFEDSLHFLSTTRATAIPFDGA